MEDPPLAEHLRKGIIELCKVTHDIDTLDLIFKLLLEFAPKEADAEKMRDSAIIIHQKM